MQSYYRINFNNGIRYGKTCEMKKTENVNYWSYIKIRTLEALPQFVKEFVEPARQTWRRRPSCAKSIGCPGRSWRGGGGRWRQLVTSCYFWTLERRGSYAARIEVSGANWCPRSALCGKMRKENALVREYFLGLGEKAQWNRYYRLCLEQNWDYIAFLAKRSQWPSYKISSSDGHCRSVCTNVQDEPASKKAICLLQCATGRK